MQELALKIADDAARGVLLMETLPATDQPEWMDISDISEEAEERVQEATEYLSMRGLLEMKAGTKLARFTDASPAN